MRARGSACVHAKRHRCVSCRCPVIIVSAFTSYWSMIVGSFVEIKERHRHIHLRCGTFTAHLQQCNRQAWHTARATEDNRSTRVRGVSAVMIKTSLRCDRQRTDLRQDPSRWRIRHNCCQATSQAQTTSGGTDHALPSIILVRTPPTEKQDRNNRSAAALSRDVSASAQGVLVRAVRHLESPRCRSEDPEFTTELTNINVSMVGPKVARILYQ